MLKKEQAESEAILFASRAKGLRRSATDQVAVMQLAATEIGIVAVGFAVSPREVYYARENAPFERAGPFTF